MLTSRCRRWGMVIGLVALATLVAGFGTASARVVPFVFDGTADTVVQQGAWTYVAGTFSQATTPAAGSVVLSTTEATPRAISAGPPGVRAGDGAGGWYVAGSQGVVHVDANGRTTWRAVTDAPVTSMAGEGESLYLAGSFTTVDGSARAGLAALRVTDGGLLPWSPAAATAPATISGVTAGMVVVTRGFDGTLRPQVAGVDAITGRPTALRLPPTNNRFSVAAVAAGRVYVIGSFTRIAGEPRRYIAALDARNGRLLHWNPHLNGRSPRPMGLAQDEMPFADITAVVPAGRVVYVSGDFTSAGGRAVSGLAALSTATARATSWAPEHIGPAQVLAADGGHVYVMSRFRRGTVTPATPWLAQIDPQTGRPSRWEAGLAFGAGWESNGLLVADVKLSATRAYVRGGFYGAGRPLATLGHIARLNADGELDTGWRPTVDGAACAQPNARSDVASGCITSIVAGPREVYLGGRFTAADGQRRDGLAAVDVTTAAVTSWAPRVTGDAVPRAIHGGDVLLAGDLTAVDGQPRRGLAAVGQASGRVTALNLNLDGPVDAMAADSNTAYLAGRFTHVGPAPRGGVAEVDLTTGQPTPWAAGVSITGDPDAVTVTPAAVYVDVPETLWTFDRQTGALTASRAGFDGTLVTVFDGRTYFQDAGGDWYSVGPGGDVAHWRADLDYPYDEYDSVSFGRKAMAATPTRIALAGAFTRTYDDVQPDAVPVVMTGPFALVNPADATVTPTTVQVP